MKVRGGGGMLTSGATIWASSSSFAGIAGRCREDPSKSRGKLLRHGVVDVERGDGGEEERWKSSGCLGHCRGAYQVPTYPCHRYGFCRGD